MSGLPGDWRAVKLGAVLIKQLNGRLLQQGWSPRCDPYPAPDNEHWGVLKTTAVQPGWFDDTQHKSLPTKLEPRPAFEVHPGDLLITSAGPRSRCGVPALVRHTRPRLMMSGKFYRFRPTEEVLPEFLELYLLTPNAQDLIDGMKTGISDSGLNLTHDRFLELPVPVPSLGEQSRIVAILEDHLSRLDAATASLAAASGRSELLRLSALARLAPEDTPLIPLGQLALDSGYGTSTKCAVGAPGVPVARIPNLVGGRIDMSDEKCAIDMSVDLSSLMLDEGDLLIIRTNGSKDLIGRSAVVQPGVQASFASYLIRYVLDPEKVNPEWVRLILERPETRLVLENLAASSAGQHNLSLGKLDGVLIPLPELVEQERLIAEFADSQDAAARATQAVEHQAARGVALRRSLLAAAFHGDLAA